MVQKVITNENNKITFYTAHSHWTQHEQFRLFDSVTKTNRKTPDKSCSCFIWCFLAWKIIICKPAGRSMHMVWSKLVWCSFELNLITDDGCRERITIMSMDFIFKARERVHLILCESGCSGWWTLTQRSLKECTLQAPLCWWRNGNSFFYATMLLYYACVFKAACLICWWWTEDNYWTNNNYSILTVTEDGKCKSFERTDKCGAEFGNQSTSFRGGTLSPRTMSTNTCATFKMLLQVSVWVLCYKQVWEQRNIK